MQLATNITKNLYGSDILIVDRMLYHVLKYETQQGGLNLTHRQDKDFIQVSIIFFVSLLYSLAYIFFKSRLNFRKVIIISLNM